MASTTASSLRCNDCGYTLDALPSGADCPECGRSVALSRPEARAGSGWQRAWRLGSALADPVRRPRAMWEDVRPEKAVRSLLLLVIVSVLTAVPMGLSVWAGGPQTGALSIGYPVVFTLGCCVLVSMLSLMEACGLVFIGWRRGWSKSPAHVLAVVGHASPGWIVGGAMCALLWQILQRIPEAWTTGRVVVSGQQVLPDGSWVWIAMLLGGGVGLMCFEMLAYAGMMRLRFTRAE